MGEVLHRPEGEVGPYRSTLASLQDLEALRKLHGEPESGTFSDYGLHSDDAALQRRSYPVEGQVQVCQGERGRRGKTGRRGGGAGSQRGGCKWVGAEGGGGGRWG